MMSKIEEGDAVHSEGFDKELVRRMFASADEALYNGKNGGRNQVVAK
jgi:PleD family two-component response regulator